MENNENTAENVMVIGQDRSYVKCLTLGLKVAFNNLGTLLRYMWPSMLLTILFPVIGIFFFAGQTDAILRRFVELGYVPAVKAKTLQREILHRTGRDVLSIVLIILALIIGAALLCIPVMLGRSIWYGALALVIWTLIALPLDFCLMRISYSDRPVFSCLGGFVRGFRNYGSLFALELMACILGGFVYLVGSLPLISMSFVSLQAQQAQQMGDLTDLPSTYYVWMGIAYVISMVVCQIVVLTLSFPHCLLWGSIEEVPADSEVEVAGIDGVVGSPERMA